MSAARLITSPGESYVRALLDALADAISFELITGFASVGGIDGIDIVAPAVRGVLERGGLGKIVIAVDHQGFNAASVFRALLDLKSGYSARLSINVAL